MLIIKKKLKPIFKRPRRISTKNKWKNINIKNSQIKKEEEELKLKIQILSEKMAFEKYKDQEVFQRLYNQPQKKNIEKEVKKMKKISNNK